MVTWTRPWISNGLVQRLAMKEEDGYSYLTNIFDLPPGSIALAYEERWDLEVLFKTLKSNLEIDHFMGKNLNSILIQIFTTLIMYLLILIF